MHRGKIVFSKKILISYAFILSIGVLTWPGNAAGYNVSGVVEFTYRGYETRSGDDKISHHTWTQLYEAGISGDFLDPRLMKFTGQAGYTIYSMSDGPDSRMLNYSLNTHFFPGTKISWELYGNKAINTFQNESNIAGYDVSTTNYGGSLNLALSGLRSRGNRNNNNNNNGGGWSIPLPDILLSHNRIESESLSSKSPIHEIRDDTKARLTYRNNAAATIDLEAGRSQYNNLLHRGDYDETSVNLQSVVKAAPDVDLIVNGRMLNRDVENITGFSSSRSYSFGALLDFQEKNRIRHFYRYSFDQQKTANSEGTAQSLEAQVQYRITPELRVLGGLNYRLAESKLSSTPPDGSKFENGGLLLGASYFKTYKPEFLGPFSFNTTYNFNTGYSKLTSLSDPADPSRNGSGVYYSNMLGLGLLSSGWQQDNISLDYSVTSKRDDSPLANDLLNQTFRASASTIRIPRTTLRAISAYQVQDAKAGTNGTFLVNQTNTASQGRTFTYDASADYRVTTYLNALLGAARAASTSTTQSFTLVALTPDQSVAKSYDTVYYGQLNYLYPIMRNLVYRATARDEYRHSQVLDSHNYQATMNLDYRFRQIILNFEYRFRQDIYEKSPRITQQYYYARLSRPF